MTDGLSSAHINAMTPEDLLARASEFTFLPAGAHATDKDVGRFALKVIWRGRGGWAVTRGFDCWGPEGWACEQTPSTRTPEYVAAHRFPLEEAAAIAEQLVDGITVDGRTWAQLQDRFFTAEAVGR